MYKVHYRQQTDSAEKCRIKKLLRCYFMANNKIDFESGFLVVCLLLEYYFYSKRNGSLDCYWPFCLCVCAFGIMRFRHLFARMGLGVVDGIGGLPFEFVNTKWFNITV
jgi:hypothetical protein